MHRIDSRVGIANLLAVFTEESIEDTVSVLAEVVGLMRLLLLLLLLLLVRLLSWLMEALLLGDALRTGLLISN